MMHVAASRLVDRLVRRLLALGAALNPVRIRGYLRDALAGGYPLFCVRRIQCFLLIGSLVLIMRFQRVLRESTST